MITDQVQLLFSESCVKCWCL